MGAEPTAVASRSPTTESSALPYRSPATDACRCRTKTVT